MEKIIEAAVNKIVVKAKAELEYKKQTAEEELDEYLENLDAASKVVLSVNLLDILANGGNVDILPLDENHEDVEIRCGNVSHYLHLKRDVKYRVLTIVERIER